MVKVSILMLTHNAPKYINISIKSIMKKTKDVDYELIVLDNNSKFFSKLLLRWYKLLGGIDKLIFQNDNLLFAAGNNKAASFSSDDCDYYLLLNSDVEIIDSNWLSYLIESHKKGISTYGVVCDPMRVDGYCYLIDKEIYDENNLDEGHQWYWAITKQQASVLSLGFSVLGYANHESKIHHFGGKSGDSFKGAKGMNVTKEEVYGWFNGKEPEVINEII